MKDIMLTQGENNSEINSSPNLFFDNLIWLNSKEAAQYLRTSVQQIRNWVYQGKLRAYRLFGKKLLFKRVDLDAAIRQIGDRL